MVTPTVSDLLGSQYKARDVVDMYTVGQLEIRQLGTHTEKLYTEKEILGRVLYFFLLCIMHFNA